MAKNDLSKLINTLKVDSTSPWVNKETLMKVMKAVDDKTYDYSVTDMTSLSDIMAEIKAGQKIYDTVNDRLYVCTSRQAEYVMLTSVDGATLNYTAYVKDGDDWILDETFSAILRDVNVNVGDEPTGTLNNVEVDGTVYGVSGGTKLYKHEFDVTDTDQNTYHIALINTSITDISSLSNVGNLISGVVLDGSSPGPQNAFFGVIILDPNTEYGDGYVLKPAGVTIPATSLEYSTDTVTPL